ncbi:response regulator [Paenibacillus sp. FSL F4-0097]|uniref:response regulator transcription factor n=1 Tax=Paenibacillus sp. FSL F4-0097 TaxID=2921369 RepID=UPI0031595344
MYPMYNVMLVDDEPIVKVALRTMIPWEELGYMICATASDGVEALTLVDKFNPHIIITDLKMPNMDGLQLIKELNNRGFAGKILVASNHGEYELVREALVLGAVDYMLKISMKTGDLIHLLEKSTKLIQEQLQSRQQQETQTQLLQHNLKSVKNALLKDYFTDPYYDVRQLDQHEAITFAFSESSCYLFYITFEQNNATHNERQNHISVSFIENIILDILETVDQLEIIQLESNGLLLLISCDTLDDHQIIRTDFIQRVIRLIKMYISITPTIVFSDPVRGYAEAKRTLERCKESLLIQFYNEITIIDPKDVHLKDTLDFEDVHDFSTQLIQNWKLSGVEAVTQATQQFLDICKSKQINPAETKKFIVNCLHYLPLCDAHLIVEDPKLLKNYIENIASSKRTTDVLSIMELVFQLFSHQKQQIVTTHNRDVKQAIDYINTHYQKKLTLSLIAKHVNLSENYLSRIFKEEVGQSIIHYINTVKMEKAADLILKGNPYIKEISTQIGIHDQFYFTRLFKKHFGVYPSEYKNHVQATLGSGN